MRTKSAASLTKPTYDHILNLILNRKLKPGDRIPEVEIAQELGISRTPVRNALQLLQGDGLVQIYPNKYVEVRSFDTSDIENIGIMRVALDTMAVRFAIFRGSNEDFQRLAQLAEKCDTAIQEGKPMEHMRWDCEFHLELTRIAQNPILERYENQLLRQMQIMLSYRFNFAVTASTTHHMIVDAMTARDEARAVNLITAHLSEFYQLGEKFPFLTPQDKPAAE